MAEPTTTEMLEMIEDLQGTVADLTFEVLTASFTTPHTGIFVPKNSPILGQAKMKWAN